SLTHPGAYLYLRSFNSYEPDHCLRSSGRNLLIVPESRLVTKADRAVAVRAPKLWNSQPS
ncbi:hypothetical protein LDENG_00209400, partial [Lucifuga dentata]